MNAYFETSAILKHVMAEEGTEEAEALWDASDVALTSRLSYSEARAALAAARRAGRLSARSLEESTRALEDRFSELDPVELTVHIARSAGDLAEKHGLRGFDAVHLASALAIDGSGVTLVTWDRALARAGRAEGMALGGITVD